MSKLAEKSGRQISLNVIVDLEQGKVQIIRNLHGTKGFLVDSGNMGWVAIDEFRAFVEEAGLRASGKQPSLFEIMTGVKRPS